MQNTIFGIRIMSGQEVSWLGSFSKDKCRKPRDKGQILPYKLINNDVYPMQPWFYFPFKDRSYGNSWDFNKKLLWIQFE